MSDPLLEAEVPLGAHSYHVSRMSVFDQMSVAADYRDILIGLALMKNDRPKDMSDAEFLKAAHFIMASRAGMTPELRTSVVSLCLRHVSRKSATGWSPVMATSGVLQFNDIELPDLMTLLYAVFEHNKLLDFFSVSPSSSGEKA